MSNPPTTDKRCCVIADDVRSSRELARRWVADLGYHCSVACNGKEAWELIVDSPPDLVLTDLEMPIESGLSLIYSIRINANESIRQVPVIAMTSLSDDQLGSVLKDLGATAVIKKPIEKAILNQTIDTVASSMREHSVCLPTKMPEGPRGRISPALQRLIADVKLIE